MKSVFALVNDAPLDDWELPVPALFATKRLAQEYLECLPIDDGINYFIVEAFIMGEKIYDYDTI